MLHANGDAEAPVGGWGLAHWPRLTHTESNEVKWTVKAARYELFLTQLERQWTAVWSVTSVRLDSRTRTLSQSSPQSQSHRRVFRVPADERSGALLPAVSRGKLRVLVFQADRWRWSYIGGGGGEKERDGEREKEGEREVLEKEKSRRKRVSQVKN